MANTPFSCLPLQVSQIQILLFCFSVLLCHVFNLTLSMLFPASMPNKVLFKTTLPATQHTVYPSEKNHNRDEQSLPQTLQPGWNIRWSGIRWHERILLKKNIAFEPCLNLRCLNSAAWVRIIWIAISKEQFHLTQGREQILLNKNFPAFFLLHDHQQPVLYILYCWSYSST